jgi:major vault protein
MIIVPPRNYCIISNPVVRDEKGKVVYEKGTAKLRHGDEEIRGTGEPFALYPGEKLFGKVSPLQVVAPLTAIKLRAIRDFTDDDGIERVAGDEWLFHGPGTYHPKIEVQAVEIVRATVVKPNEALKLRAKKEFRDCTDVDRRTGEEWLVRRVGAYMPNVQEEIVQTVAAIILTEKKALHLNATRNFKDAYGKDRKAGEEWLVTKEQSEKHIPDVFERIVGEVSLTTLNSRQYAVVLDPVGTAGKKPTWYAPTPKGRMQLLSPTWRTS